MSTIGVVVLHHDRSVVEQVAEAIEGESDLFVAATSLEAGARASVVIAGGEPLHACRDVALPLVALAEDEPVRAARAALAAGARDIIRWPHESDRLGHAARRAAAPAPAAGRGAPLIAVVGARGGLGTSTLAAMIAGTLEDALLIDLDGGQRTFTEDAQQVRLPADPDPEVVRALAAAHVGTARALHVGGQIDPPAARGLFRAARQAAAAVVVDAGRARCPDADLTVLVTGCDVASVRAAKRLLDDATLVALRRTRYSLGRREVAGALERGVDLLVQEDPAVVRAADLGRLPPPGNRTMRAVARFAKTLKERL